MDGPVYGGFAVVIEGRGFIDTGKIVVRFQLYTEQQQEATPRVEDENVSVKVPPVAGLSHGKSGSSFDRRQGDIGGDAPAFERAGIEASTEPSVSYVDVIGKFVSTERVLCQAPSFPQEGVYTVLVALNRVEFSRVSDGSWFLSWQNWQKRKRLLSHALFSRATAPDEATSAAAIAGAAAASASLDENDIERLRRKSSFMLPKIKSAMAAPLGETSSVSFTLRNIESVSEDSVSSEEAEKALMKDPRLLQWQPASTMEVKVRGRPLLALLEYLCSVRETQQLICRHIHIAFKLQSAKSRGSNDPSETAPALQFPSFVEAIRMVFPNALKGDLEELWHAAEHRPDGTVAIKQLLRRLLRNTIPDQRCSSPEPGPTHYDPRYSIVTSRDTAAIILPPVVQPEHISDPPSALFMDYDAAVQAVKPRPPRPIFRKRKFNTSWCNPVVEGAPDPTPPRSNPDTSRSRTSPRVQVSESDPSVLPPGDTTVAAAGTSEDSLEAKPEADNVISVPQTARGQASSGKEDLVRAPRSLDQGTVASNNKRIRSPTTPRRSAITQEAATPPNTSPALMPRQTNLSGANPFYNDIAPLYAKFLNSAEVKRFLNQQ
ncbi:unnamed protein product [Phytophthora fragariaefolia]|uniref:Unnamed protein product n=1 Tax=Phytophthora fragariaefolia TaxID=1490495 RepID=A0A9W7DCT8_9STRA|nr:unnamed protein product [Phytophthora fragariaefolia]